MPAPRNDLEHPSKQTLIENRVPFTHVAKDCDCSYHHLVKVLSGYIRPSKKLNRKLREIVNRIESEES